MWRRGHEGDQQAWELDAANPLAGEQLNGGTTAQYFDSNAHVQEEKAERGWLRRAVDSRGGTGVLVA